MQSRYVRYVDQMIKTDPCLAFVGFGSFESFEIVVTCFHSSYWQRSNWICGLFACSRTGFRHLHPCSHECRKLGRLLREKPGEITPLESYTFLTSVDLCPQALCCQTIAIYQLTQGCIFKLNSLDCFDLDRLDCLDCTSLVGETSMAPMLVLPGPI